MESERHSLVCYTSTRQRMAMNLAILSRTRRACEHLFMRGKIFTEALRSKYALPALGGFVALLILIAYVRPVNADAVFGPLTDQTGYTIFGPILGLVSGLLYLIVKLLLMLNNALADMMIQAAQYNNFVQAQPVLIGWPLVRDVCNMFFILVLLVVAFSTIIGYEKFHYKKVVPKLLLMSVLINFSKTLVGLLIDFSQVLTLTFVNGFRAAALGNFMAAFGLTDMLTVMQGAYGATDHDPSEVIIALVFAVGMLSVVATIMLIMCIYFIVRIVMLWVLLIFSPAAFFATALPDTLKASLSTFTGEWWKKLSTMLTGGPIIAFFLWLTFAMVQNGGDNFAVTEKIYTPGSAADQAQLGVTVTGVGRPEKMQTFLVAAIMLMIGLSTAVRVSTETAGQLGQVANKIKSTGGPAGWAAMLGYKAGKGTAKAVDRRWGISSGIGKALVQEGAQSPNSMFGKAAGIMGAGLVSISQKDKAAAKKKLEERGGQVPLSMQAAFYKSQGGSTLASNKYETEEAQKLALAAYTKGGYTKGIEGVQYLAANGTDDVKEASAMQIGAWAMDSNALKSRKEAYVKAGMSDGDADARVRGEAAVQIAAGLAAAEARNDEDKIKAFKSYLEKRPDMVAPGSDVSGYMKEAIANPERLFSYLQSDSLKDTRVVEGLFKSFLSTGDYEGLRNSKAYEKVMAGGGEIAKTVAAHIDGLESRKVSTGLDARMTMTPTGLAYATIGTGVAATGPASTYNSWSDVTRGLGAAAVPPAALTITVSEADDIAKKIGVEIDMDKMKHLADRSSGRSAANLYATGPMGSSYSVSERAVMQQGQMKGLPSSVTVGYDTATGTYGTAEQEVADAENMNEVMMNIASTDINDRIHAISYVANMDTQAIQQGGKMAENVVKIMSTPGRMDNLGTISEEAQGEMAKKVEEVVRSIYKSTNAINKRSELGERFSSGSKEEQALMMRKAMEKHKELKKFVARIT